MSVRTPPIDVEEITTTRSEKLLAVVLAVFIAIGSLWAYVRLDEWARSAVAPSVSAVDRASVERLRVADALAARAAAAESAALNELVLSREAYRTALDAERQVERLRLAYVARQHAYTEGKAATRAASASAAALQPAAAAAAERIADEEQRAADREALLAFGLRLVLVASALAFGLWLLARLRRAGSRSLPLAFSVVGSATVLAVVMACDYVTDYVDPLELGPLVLSVMGVVVTLPGFAVLQRYLARRIPSRRVRKGECPFCGYPVGQGGHCEGCGREVIATCSSCASPRRVGTVHGGARAPSRRGNRVRRPFPTPWPTRVSRASYPTKSCGLRGGPEQPLAVHGRRTQYWNTGPEGRVPRAANGRRRRPTLFVSTACRPGADAGPTLVARCDLLSQIAPLRAGKGRA
jgi:hypothetical protein